MLRKVIEKRFALLNASFDVSCLVPFVQSDIIYSL